MPPRLEEEPTAEQEGGSDGEQDSSEEQRVVDHGVFSESGEE